ncbi:MAG: DMT family transporter [Acidimicrobiales bacterium]
MHKVALHGSLVANVILWGFTFPAIARILEHVDAIQLTTIWVTANAAVFAALMYSRPAKRPRVTRSDLPRLLLMGVVAVPMTQIPVVYGQRFLSPPLTSVIVSTSPVWATLLAVALLSERIRPRQVAGFAIALCGATIVILAGSGETELTVDNPWGAALTLVTPIGWALYTVLSKTMTDMDRYSPVDGVGLVLVAGALTMIPLMPHAAKALDDLPASAWGWMLFLVFGGTVGPYLIWFRALRRLDASQTAAYMFGVPFAALGASWLVLDIVPDAIALVGGGLIIGGVVVAQLAADNSNPPERSAANDARVGNRR